MNKKTLTIIFALGAVCFVALGQDDGTTTNNWNSMPDLAPTEPAWDYALSPAWYYWEGFGIAIFVGITGLLVKAFQSITGAGDSGGT